MFLVAIILTCSFPYSANAMKIFVDLPESQIKVGNTTLLKIMIDTEGQEINALEGKIYINNPKDITSITTGGSIFSLWPRRPSLDEGLISFTGGTPSGVYGNSLRVFTIAIKPTTPEKIKINFSEVASFLSDGLGTKVSVTGSPVEISVNSDDLETTEDNELANLVIDDKNPPNKFSIDIGREETLHDGKYFLSFYATDNESGINRYEVKENDLPTVRSGSVYVLQDQSLTGTVEVRAIDNAGNVRIESINLSGSDFVSNVSDSVSKLITEFVLILIVIGIAILVILKIRKSRRSRIVI